MPLSRVAIVGYALEKYSAESSAYAEELGYRVVRRARQKAGLSRDAVSSVHNSTMDLFDGVTISNGILGPAAGGYDRDCTRIQNGGVFALLSAYAAIRSGASDVAVVSSVDTVTTDLLQVSRFSSSAYFEQPLGMNFLTSYALFSSAWLQRRGPGDDLIAAAAESDYAAGAKNPYADVQSGFSSADVLRSEIVAAPLRARAVTLRRSYGAAALILASEDAAKRLTATPVYVAGFGMGMFTDDVENWLSMEALERAAREAYGMAQVRDPRREIAAVEINAPFVPFELAALAPLGLCAPGEEAQALSAGRDGAGGPQINPSGGTLCTNAPNSGGVFRVAQAVLALERRPGAGRQRGVVHDSDLSLGVGGSSHALLVLEREAR